MEEECSETTFSVWQEAARKIENELNKAIK